MKLINTELNICLQSDWGGPLTVVINGQIRVIGVVSQVNPPCEEGYAHVYTRLTEYLNWIEDHSDILIDP